MLILTVLITLLLAGLFAWLPGRLCGRGLTRADLLAGPGLTAAVWLWAACIYEKPGLAVDFDAFRLLGITAMSQALGRKKFEELLGGLVYKPPGKPVLVPESDKRPAMNTAINDFKENEEDNNYGKDRK